MPRHGRGRHFGDSFKFDALRRRSLWNSCGLFVHFLMPSESSLDLIPQSHRPNAVQLFSKLQNKLVKTLRLCINLLGDGP
jgi:hypothetical protein